MMHISFLASHGGSAARYLIAAMRGGGLEAVPGVVITNNRDAAIVPWCRRAAVPVLHISSATHPDEELRDLAIRDALAGADSALVVLSGYMKKIGVRTLARFPGRILNIHPALLPQHGGQGMYGDRVHAAVLACGDRVSGASVHIIDEDYDTGPVILQRRVPVRAADTVESLRARVQQIEGPLYLEAIRALIDAPPGVQATRPDPPPTFNLRRTT